MSSPLDLGSPAVLKDLDAKLVSQPYVSGFEASSDDVAVWAGLPSVDRSALPNLARWHAHVAALLLKSFPVGLVRPSRPFTFLPRPSPTNPTVTPPPQHRRMAVLSGCTYEYDESITRWIFPSHALLVGFSRGDGALHGGHRG